MNQSLRIIEEIKRRDGSCETLFLDQEDGSIKLLIVTSNFVPEIGSAAHIYFDLAKTFVKRGNEVHVITSYPRSYNLDANKLEKYPLEEDIEGIKVHRCLHPTLRDVIALRGMEHFILPSIYFRRYKKLGEKFDACLIYIPPLPLYTFARMLKRRDGTPSILNYQDFHPQELTDVGVLKNKFFIKLMELIEKRSYNTADYITVITSGGYDYVKERGCVHDRIDHIFNGYSPNGFDDVTADFKERHGLKGKFLVTYAGILSPFQGLDVILDAAKKIRSRSEVQFLIAGDGMIKDHLDRRIIDENISNVRLLPFLPRAEYQKLIKSSDVCLVSLDDRMKAPCLPGKLVSLLAASKPIVAPVPSDSETAKVISSQNIGIVVNPRSPDMLAAAIIDLMKNQSLRETLATNGKAFLEKNMDVDKNAETYEGIFEKVKMADDLPRVSASPLKIILGAGREDGR